MFYLQKRPDNDVAPGNANVGSTCRPRPKLSIPSSTPTTPPPKARGEMHARRWGKDSLSKNHRPPFHRARHCRHQKPPCHAPIFRYHPRKLLSWLLLYHRFQCHYSALHDLPPYPYVMPSTPKLVNPYLTPPDHIATQNDTNILHSVGDAHRQTSKWSSHEDKELRPPAPQNEETPCESLSDASISFSCNEDNFCPTPHIEEDEDTNSSFTNHPYHPSTPPGSSNGCA